MSTITKTVVVNLALAHLGDNRIDDIDDSDPAASDLRDQWDIARLTALSSSEWSFATKFQQLNQSGTAPVAEYEYAYGKPADWVRTNAVSDDNTFDRQNPFRNWRDMGGQILTDASTLYIDYVYDHTTVGAWPGYFVDYMSMELALRINPKITTSQSHGKNLYQMRQDCLGMANARNAQTQPVQKRPMGSWRRARRGGELTWRR